MHARAYGDKVHMAVAAELPAIGWLSLFRFSALTMLARPFASKEWASAPAHSAAECPWLWRQNYLQSAFTFPVQRTHDACTSFCKYGMGKTRPRFQRKSVAIRVVDYLLSAFTC